MNKTVIRGNSIFAMAKAMCLHLGLIPSLKAGVTVLLKQH